MGCLAHDPADRPAAADLAHVLSAASTSDAASEAESANLRDLVDGRVASPEVVQTRELAATEAFAPTLLAPTRFMPDARSGTGAIRRRPWLRLAAAGLAPFTVAALATAATGIGPSDNPVPSQAQPPAPVVAPPAVVVPDEQPPSASEGSTSNAAASGNDQSAGTANAKAGKGEPGVPGPPAGRPGAAKPGRSHHDDKDQK